MWLFFMLLSVRKNPKYMFLFFGNNLFLQEQRLMTTTILLLSTFGLSGLPALHPWGEEDYSSLFVTGFKQRAFVLWAQSIEWDNDLKCTKHTLREMIVHYSCLEFPEGKGINCCCSLSDIA
jgi:hypothetical protein